ncbi:hypothetical protein LGR54_13410 [Ancylobacter sp. Lp-2]|uniref:hypothetical protein n=1 Tax=Ancylobacter sp. Lp-2 TaxID=2881339 RepID=UPI001E32E0FA|nr:hypothetical protein [Ancylobacter sp. Lp-2]MCB4769610.1 hypothetical protein [Ancylobacter sp. Lp-2]
MNKKTFYVVQAYETGRRGVISVGIPIEARTSEDAARIAKRLSIIRLGAIAFSRDTGSDEKGLGKPVIIASFGRVPETVTVRDELP